MPLLQTHWPISSWTTTSAEYPTTACAWLKRAPAPVKPLAYLLAVLPIARALDKKVVVATATISLQEQLVLRDIPDLLQRTGWNHSFALAKGRGRYLCPLKLEQCLDQAADSQAGQGLFPDEMLFNPTADSIKLYQSMADALAANEWQGDRDSWPDGVEQQQWQPLTRRSPSMRRSQLSPHQKLLFLSRP